METKHPEKENIASFDKARENIRPAESQQPIIVRPDNDRPGFPIPAR